MKKYIGLLLLLLWLQLEPPVSGLAQTPASNLASLEASFWPDYDEPSVLVLLTGTFSAATGLPAEVTIPVPEDATINAVAQASESGMTIVDYTLENGLLTLVATQPRFRVEYYAPYRQDGQTRSYVFAWQSSLDVEEFSAEIQQPASASSLRSEPSAVDIFTSPSDGLVYHQLGAQSLPANTPYRLSFSYEMEADELTAAPTVSDGGSTNSQAPPPALESSANWPLIAAGLGVIGLAIGGTWFVTTRTMSKQSKRPPKPSPKKTASRKAEVFCHNCGQPAASNDRFCRHCGTELKVI